MREMTVRRRFQAVMNFRPFDRLPVVEWAPWWDKTIERWRAEGLPRDLEGYRINRHFGLDIYRQDWVRPQGPECPRAPRHGAGIIADENDYEALLAFLYPEDPVDAGWWRRAAPAQAAGAEVLWLTLDGFFWWPRVLFGIETHMYAFYDQPGLMHRINADLAEYNLRVIDAVSEIAVPDFCTFAEDMSYNHGPMLSRDLFDEFMKPYYLKVVPRLKELGILAIIDSDGDVTVPAGWFAESGLDGILPLERRCGVDVAALRRSHPHMRFLGAFDKMVMNRGEAAMRAEFERLLPTAAGGGLVIGCDHQTPPGVSLTDYRLYLSLFREYAERAGEMSRTGSARRE